MRRGKLIAIEGPDGVGKTSMASALMERFEIAGIPAINLSFPGKEEGTLGHLVYRLHHDAPKAGVPAGLTPTSLQALHVAAHLDAIEARIIPKVNEGIAVVLDRFWWSTWVYGILGGIDPQVLKGLIDTEKRIWAGYTPDLIILIDRSVPLRADSVEGWQPRREEYRKLAERESEHQNVIVVSNDRSKSETATDLWRLICQVEL